MKNYYSIILFRKDNDINFNEKCHSFRKVFNRFEGKFYFRKGWINEKQSVSCNGIDNYSIADCLRKGLQESYETQKKRHTKIEGLEFKITRDIRYDFFKNDRYFNIYRDTAINFDRCLNNYYFNNGLSYVDIINAMVEIYLQYAEINELYISHWSHFWGFFTSLTIEQQKAIYEYLNRQTIQFKPNNILFDCFDVLFNQIVELLETDSEFNFYSPRRKEDIYNQDNYSSKLHKYTHQVAMKKK